VACPLPAYSRESVYEGRIALMRACQTERRTHDRYCLQSPKGEFTRSPVHRWRFTLIFRLPGYGLTYATKGALRVQLVRATRKSSEAKGGTGVHFHTADIHVVYMVSGWAKFDYDGVDTLVEAGDCVHQRPGIVHSLYDWSDDMEFMEIIMPGDFATTEITAPAELTP